MIFGICVFVILYVGNVILDGRLYYLGKVNLSTYVFRNRDFFFVGVRERLGGREGIREI